MEKKTGTMHTLQQIINYSKALQNVDFYSGDYHDIISNAESGDFVYLDPPYSKPDSRNRGEYGPNSFHFSDIEKMMALLTNLDKRNVSFALSYCECEEIRDSCHPSWNIASVDVRRHVAGFNVHRKTVKEVIITNQNCVFMAA